MLILILRELLSWSPNDEMTKTEIVRNTDEETAKELLSNKDEGFFGPLEGKPPAVFILKRKGEYVVRIEKEGYQTVEVKILHETAGGGAAGIAGNVLISGLIGVAVDSSSGATQDLAPNPIEVNLQKAEDEN